MFETIFKAFREHRNETLETQRIVIQGMTCRRCVQTVKKALLTKSGVKEVYIDLKNGFASVKFDPNQTDLASLHEIIIRKGYFPVVANLV